MNRIIKEVGAILMAIAAMITMNACSIINNDTAKEVCDALSAKYGESFSAIKIGDRFNASRAKLYIHPNNQQDLLFTASIDRNTGEVNDDYITQKVNRMVETAVVRAFADYKITAKAKSVVVKKKEFVVENNEYSPKTFAQQYGLEDYFVYLVLDKETASSESIVKALIDSQKLCESKLVFIIYVFDSNGYSQCVDYLSETPEPSATIIESYSPSSIFKTVANNGEISLTTEEINDFLRGN